MAALIAQSVLLAGIAPSAYTQPSRSSKNVASTSSRTSPGAITHKASSIILKRTPSSSRGASRQPLLVRAQGEVAVQLGGAQSDQESSIEVGARIRVKESVKVYHIPKVKEFDLSGCEGEVKDVVTTFKGKPISSTLPYKVQFESEIEGNNVKFIAHLRADEVDVL
eukprot:jgi/Mesen1/1288/ME000013S00782